MTPRLFTYDWSCTADDPRLIDGIFILSSCCRVPSQVNCVLSAFNFNRLEDIHASISDIHPTTFFTTLSADWLPFPDKIKFKLCSTVYKCLYEAAPAYLSELCVPLSSQAGHSQLRSVAAVYLLIPPTRTVTIGGRGFSVAGPVAWNSLPTDLKDGTLTFPVFKKLLKTHSFDTIWTSTRFNSIQYIADRLRVTQIGLDKYRAPRYVSEDLFSKHISRFVTIAYTASRPRDALLSETACH